MKGVLDGRGEGWTECKIDNGMWIMDWIRCRDAGNSIVMMIQLAG